MENAIIFTGCSYTFGEGLELYSDTPKWINQRNYQTDDFELKQIHDSDGTNFRLNNNFPSIVSKHFNTIPIQSNKNGGSFASSLRFIRKNQATIKKEKTKKIVSIIFQLSSFSREPFHFDYSCECDLCEGTLWAYWGEFYMHLEYLSDLISKKTNTEQIIRFQTSIDDKNRNVIIKYFSGIMKLIYNDFDYDYFVQKSLENKEYFSTIMETVMENIDDIKNKQNKDVLTSLQATIEKFEREIAPVYFIDSWCEDTSKLIFNNEFYYNKLIRLKGDDGKYYKKWTEWEKTIKNRLVKDDFPNTHNHHPSLHSHQRIGESIIDFLNKKPFLEIKYI